MPDLNLEINKTLNVNITVFIIPFFFNQLSRITFSDDWISKCLNISLIQTVNILFPPWEEKVPEHHSSGTTPLPYFHKTHSLHKNTESSMVQLNAL